MGDVALDEKSAVVGDTAVGVFTEKGTKFFVAGVLNDVKRQSSAAITYDVQV